MNAALMKSERTDWNTPIEVVNIIRQFARNGEIWLDPCSNRESVVGAKVELEADGLASTWKGPGLTYVNPPYGRQIGQWTKKAFDEAQSGAEVLMLLPARTDTAWFYDCWAANALCFWLGRIKFQGARHSAPFPSVFVYFGPRVIAFDLVFSNRGKVVVP